MTTEHRPKWSWRRKLLLQLALLPAALLAIELGLRAFGALSGDPYSAELHLQQNVLVKFGHQGFRKKLRRLEQLMEWLEAHEQVPQRIDLRFRDEATVLF